VRPIAFYEKRPIASAVDPVHRSEPVAEEDRLRASSLNGAKVAKCPSNQGDIVPGQPCVKALPRRVILNGTANRNDRIRHPAATADPNLATHLHRLPLDRRRTGQHRLAQTFPLPHWHKNSREQHKNCKDRTGQITAARRRWKMPIEVPRRLPERPPAIPAGRSTTDEAPGRRPVNMANQQFQQPQSPGQHTHQRGHAATSYPAMHRCTGKGQQQNWPWSMRPAQTGAAGARSFACQDGSADSGQRGLQNEAAASAKPLQRATRRAQSGHVR